MPKTKQTLYQNVLLPICQQSRNLWKTLLKMIQQNWSKCMKIGPGSHKNGDYKNKAKKHRRIMENIKKWTQNGSPDAVMFWSSGSFFCARRSWEPKWLPSPKGQGPPQKPLRLVQSSIYIDLKLIVEDSLMIVSIMWATFDLACQIMFLVTSSFHFQISGHKSKFVGVVRRCQ